MSWLINYLAARCHRRPPDSGLSARCHRRTDIASRQSSFTLMYHGTVDGVVFYAGNDMSRGELELRDMGRSILIHGAIPQCN